MEVFTQLVLSCVLHPNLIFLAHKEDKFDRHCKTKKMSYHLKN